MDMDFLNNVFASKNDDDSNDHLNKYFNNDIYEDSPFDDDAPVFNDALKKDDVCDIHDDLGLDNDGLTFPTLNDDNSKSNDCKNKLVLPETLKKCYIYEIKAIEKIIYDSYEASGIEDANTDSNIVSLAYSIRNMLEYYIRTNKLHHDIKAYIDEHVHRDAQLIVDFIDLTIDIANGKVYSTRYFDNRLSFHSSDYRNREFCLNLLKSTYYYHKHARGYGYSSLNTSANKDNTYTDVDDENIIQTSSSFDSDILYQVVDSVFADIDKDIKDLFAHINNVIGGLEIADIYELLSHKHKEPTRSYYYNRTQDYPKTDDLRDCFYKYIDRRTKKELQARVENVCSHNVLHDIFSDLLSMPSGFNIHAQDTETTRMILWAWNYIFLHKPDGMELTKNTQEQHVFVHLVDVLPALENHYRRKYRSFEKRYNSSARKHYFTDQSDFYKKNHTVAVNGFFVKKIPGPENVSDHKTLSEPGSNS